MLYVLKVQEIRELIKLVDNSSLVEFVYELDGSKIKLKKSDGQSVVTQVTSAPVQAQPKVEEVVAKEVKTAAAEAPAKVETAEVAENLHQITSPMVGSFYAAPSPEDDNYVKVGDKVPVKVIEIDDQGRINLTMKDLVEVKEDEVAETLAEEVVNEDLE